MTRWLAVGLAGFMGTASLQAATVYRCPAPPGSASLAVYGDQPCPKGQAIDAQDERSSQQQHAAKARAREEARWANQMARQRQHDERAQAAQAQRQAAVMGRERVEISRTARSDALREAELRRMARPPRRDTKPPAPEPPPAAAGTAPKATPGRP